MFQRMMEWIKGVLAKMLNPTDVKKAFSVDVAISAPMATALQLWDQIYKNQSPWLADTTIKSLGLGPAIAGEIARSVTIEMKVTLSSGARGLWLQEQINKVLPKLRDQVEFGCAKGGLILKPYLTADKMLAVDFVPADCFYPVSFDANQNLTGVIFSDQKKIGTWWYTRLEYQAMGPKGYEIHNRAFRSDNQSTLGTEVALTEVDDWADLAPDATVVNVQQPLFGYFRFPLANNIDPQSPMGISCYARAVDLIKQADEQWTNLLWEFESGKRAIYVDELAFDKDKDGKPLLPNQRLYRTLKTSGQIGKQEKMYEDWTPEMREANLLNGLDAILKRIEFTCGLAFGTLSDPNEIAKTATEIAAAKQRSFATVTDTQKSLQSALEQLLYAMDLLGKLYKLAPTGSYSTTFDFDDSIVVDRKEQLATDLSVVGGGIMSKVEFRMRNYKEDEPTARRMLAMVTEETKQEIALQPDPNNPGA